MALSTGENLLRWNIRAREHVAEFGEGAVGKMLADVAHDFHVHEAVVDAEHAKSQDFIHIQQMAEVCPGKILASVTFAAFLNRAKICLVKPSFDADGALVGERCAVACDASGQHA